MNINITLNIDFGRSTAKNVWSGMWDDFDQAGSSVGMVASQERGCPVYYAEMTGQYGQ